MSQCYTVVSMLEWMGIDDLRLIAGVTVAEPDCHAEQRASRKTCVGRCIISCRRGQPMVWLAIQSSPSFSDHREALNFCRYVGAVLIRRTNMLTRFGWCAGFVVVVGLVSVETVTAAEAVPVSDSYTPSAAQSSNSTLIGSQSSRGQWAAGSVATVPLRPVSVRSAGAVPGRSGKPIALTKMKSTPKRIYAEKRPNSTAKVAAASAVALRSAEASTKSSVRAVDVGAPLNTPPAEVSVPMVTAPDYASVQPNDAYSQARSLEGENQMASAIPLYVQASRQGHSAASLRLMEIYAMGAEGVSRNYIAAVEFKRLAVQQGARLEYLPRR